VRRQRYVCLACYRSDLRGKEEREGKKGKGEGYLEPELSFRRLGSLSLEKYLGPLKSEDNIPPLPPSIGSVSSDPAAIVRLICGTSINVQESMNAFKSFINDFRVEIRKALDGEPVLEADRDLFYPKLLNQVPSGKGFLCFFVSERPCGRGCSYAPSARLLPPMISQMKETEVYSMNLDCRNLLAYGPSAKLYHQLVRYPQEIISFMDHTLTGIFLDMFDADLGNQSLRVG